MCGSSYRPRNTPTDNVQNDNVNDTAQINPQPIRQPPQQQNQRALSYPTHWNNQYPSNWGPGQHTTNSRSNSLWPQRPAMTYPTTTAQCYTNPPNCLIPTVPAASPYEWQQFNQAHYPQHYSAPPIRSPPLLQVNQAHQRNYPNGM